MCALFLEGAEHVTVAGVDDLAGAGAVTWSKYCRISVPVSIFCKHGG